MSKLVKSLEAQGYEFSTSRVGKTVVVYVSKNGQLVASADAHFGHAEKLKIEGVGVTDSERHKKIGTAIYEIMYSEACKEKTTLISDHIRSVFAESFWRKQANKGKARCFEEGQGTVFKSPLKELLPTISEKCKKTHSDFSSRQKCISTEIQNILSKLPKPEVEAGREFWPCKRWEMLKQNSCNISLEGVKSRKKKQR